MPLAIVEFLEGRHHPADPGYGQGHPIPPHVGGGPVYNPTDPSYSAGHPLPPHIGGGPATPPGHVSGQPVPPSGTPMPPIYYPPTIYPPGAQPKDSDFLLLVWVPHVGLAWVIVDSDLAPANPLPTPPAHVSGGPAPTPEPKV